MKKYNQQLLVLVIGLLYGTVNAEDEVELNTTIIKGNKELPQMMYIVPWQDMRSTKTNEASQDLTLHSLFGDVFDPILPAEGSDLVISPDQVRQ